MDWSENMYVHGTLFFFFSLASRTASFLGSLVEPGDVLMVCRWMLGLKHESLVT